MNKYKEILYTTAYTPKQMGGTTTTTRTIEVDYEINTAYTYKEPLDKLNEKQYQKLQDEIALYQECEEGEEFDYYEYECEYLFPQEELDNEYPHDSDGYLGNLREYTYHLIK